MKSSPFFAPAKLNLFLAVTGRRSDGFHDLVSVAAPVTWGDTLRVEPGKEYSLACDDATVPVDETNLVLKAARAFRAATGGQGGAQFFLEKRIPMGAGLGGGSSDAVATLRALNERADAPLNATALETLAAGLGSDCALFLHDGPVVMRGKGEAIQALPPAARERLRGQRVLIFKPAFGIATPWAYRQIAAQAPQSYLPVAAAEERLSAWLSDASRGVEELLFNSFEAPAFAKYVALPTLAAELRERFGLAAHLTGSGSACFALLPETAPLAEIVATLRAGWGPTAFVAEARLL